MTTFPLLAVLSLAIAGIQLEKVVSHDLYSSQPPYRAEDDVSWAIHSPQLSTLLGDHTQKLYDEFITNCKKAVAETDDNDNPRICLDDEENRMLMNKYQPASVYNYTRQGFAKIRAPEKMFKLISKFYRLNQGRDTKEWKQINTYHNLWDAPPTICHLNQRENSGGGPHLQAILFGQAKRVLEDWTGQELAPVSLYGIRLYHNGSILAPHVDRMPLIISAIINVDQDVDDPWPLEVYGHDGVAVNITMEPGDMVLYESHSVIHGRPFPLKGSFYANVFVHFEPIGPKGRALETYDPDLDIPPYLIPGSRWHHRWTMDHEKGWLHETFDARTAATRGDLTTLRLIAEHDPNELEVKDELGWEPIHEAVRSGHMKALDLFLEHNIDINKKTYTGVSPLNIAREFLGEDHAVTKKLVENGAIDINEDGEL